ncbi:23S rRNA (guanosine2251-2'-O)-methyltransferase [Arboricoccus pini]|uniref:23S rRNA (Guanosine2251-2'-O)-methyltransferase n=1 Tax=Arboricoccus pini TaxID=1963835 RepID=A0A212QU31_9PROT|nr:23S rRNA (guanosine(2251)-2'-O)-methyltransferase RlmB [Arboricoccus pini]SNB63153.1 23S rRNA (guanosine2251-2'-O)-methyltransferase [Arboricoccus pini]
MPAHDRMRFYGLHAVQAALLNPARPVYRLIASRNALQRLGDAAARRGVDIEEASPRQLERLVGQDSVHQGLVLEVGPLAQRALTDVISAQPAPAVLLALDQVEDPRNVGAILRSATAMGADAVIIPERGSALLGPLCAKAASGGLDIVPVVGVANLAQSLLTLREEGFWSLGLDGAADLAIEAAPRYPRTVLVVGSEGRGLRRLTGEHCDLMVKLTIDPRMESLNVSVAAGIALYTLRHPGRS